MNHKSPKTSDCCPVHSKRGYLISASSLPKLPTVTPGQSSAIHSWPGVGSSPWKQTVRAVGLIICEEKMSWLSTRSRRRRIDSAASLTASYAVSQDARGNVHPPPLSSANDIEPLKREQMMRTGLLTLSEPCGVTHSATVCPFVWVSRNQTAGRRQSSQPSSFFLCPTNTQSARLLEGLRLCYFTTTPQLGRVSGRHVGCKTVSSDKRTPFLLGSLEQSP